MGLLKGELCHGVEVNDAASEQLHNGSQTDLSRLGQASSWENKESYVTGSFTEKDVAGFCTEWDITTLCTKKDKARANKEPDATKWCMK